jgi:ABC-type lipoprotein release transport system permease subunit
VGVTHTTAIHSLLSDEEFKFVRQYDVYTSALYFTDMDFCTDIYYQTEDTAFYMGNQNIEAIYQVIDVVEIFKEYFNLIGFIIAAIGFLLLVSYHAGNLKSRRYEIGVLRSMGCKTRTIGSIFFLQSLLIGIITALLFLIGTVTLTDTVNGILIESFKTYINSPAIAYIDAVKILEFSALSALVDIALTIAISVLSAVVPISTIRKINPISILRARE